MGQIFINYRREEAPDAAARIHRELSSAFGAKNLFLDVDNLLAGQRFDRELEKALAECDVLVVVIGPRWMSALEHRKKTSERDYVREEIAAALKRQIHIIPVLVNEAQLPSGRLLPENIRAFVRHQKRDVRREHFGRDVVPLIDAIKLLRRPPSRRLPWSMIVAAVVGLGFLTATMFLLLPHFASAPTPNSRETFRDCPDCPEMVVVPAGEFWMGSSSLEQGHTSQEEPQHKVKIAKPFAAGKFEVTFTEWDACVSDGGCNGYRPIDEG
jgi:formylglycine-generating enzyme required for sulfatase activity